MPEKHCVPTFWSQSRWRRSATVKWPTEPRKSWRPDGEGEFFFSLLLARHEWRHGFLNPTRMSLTRVTERPLTCRIDGSVVDLNVGPQTDWLTADIIRQSILPEALCGFWTFIPLTDLDRGSVWPLAKTANDLWTSKHLNLSRPRCNLRTISNLLIQDPFFPPFLVVSVQRFVSLHGGKARLTRENLQTWTYSWRTSASVTSESCRELHL